MSAPKRWSEADSEATDAERSLLSAGKKGSFTLGDDRKAELRRALAVTLATPPGGGDGDGGGGGGGGGGVGQPSSPSPPPSALAQTSAASAIGKVLLSGKASAGLLAFGLAATTTAVVLGVATRSTPAPRAVVEPPAVVIRGAGAPTRVLADGDQDKQVDESAPTAAARGTGGVPSAQPTSLGRAPGRREEGPESVGQPSVEAKPAAATDEAPAPVVVAAEGGATSPTSSAPLLSATPLVVPSLAQSRLAEESARVREARDRLRSGDARGSLESLTSLARDIPGGTLIQEREALFIEALSATGRSAEARTHAEHFLQRYPASAFVGRVRPFAGAAP
jgi:hypothetical protein